MIYFREPDERTIVTFLAKQVGTPFTYPEVGCTTSEIDVPGYQRDRTRGLIGHGREDFERAKDLLRGWKQFSIPWIRLHRQSQFAGLGPSAGETVAVVAHVLGIWILNACRVVTITEEATRFAYAYGTTPDHVESGEERFSVQWDPQGGSVWFEILAYSRPRQWFARAGYPYARSMQRRFARDAISAMTRQMQPHQ